MPGPLWSLTPLVASSPGGRLARVPLRAGKKCQPTHNQKRADKLARNGCRGKRFGGFLRSEELTFAQESAELELTIILCNPLGDKSTFTDSQSKPRAAPVGSAWAQALSL